MDRSHAWKTELNVWGERRVVCPGSDPPNTSSDGSPASSFVSRSGMFLMVEGRSDGMIKVED